MVLTRSQDGREQPAQGTSTQPPTLQGRTFDDPPQSPSAGTGGERSEPPLRRAVTIRTPPQSVRSGSGTAARIRAAEVAAAEQIAIIRRKELELETELVKTRLAAEVASIHEEEKIASENGDPIQERVEGWLRDQRERPTIDTTPLIEFNTDVTRGERLENERYSRSPIRTPARERQRSSGRAIEHLAEVIRDLAYRPGRQDLPIFSGAPSEWLPFRAAIRDSASFTKGTPAENLAKLRASLKGEAREVVAALLYTAADPTQIIRTLDQYYGRPEHVVDRALDDIKQLPKLGPTATELNKFAIKLQNIVAIIQNIDNKGYLNNPMLVRDVLEKLNPHTKTRWCDFASERRLPGEPDIMALSRFLMNEANKAVMYSYAPTSSTSTIATPKPAPKKPARVFNASATSARGSRSAQDSNDRAIDGHENVNSARNGCSNSDSVNNRDERSSSDGRFSSDSVSNRDGRLSDNGRNMTLDMQCLCCGNRHTVPECARFAQKDLHDRWELAKKTRLCFLCLKSRHRRSNCKASTCNICNRPHHPLLHEHRQQENNDRVPETVVTASATIEKQVLLKICPVTLEGPLGSINTFALLDEGATVSLMDEDLARRLTNKGTLTPLTIKGVNATVRQEASQQVRLSIKGRYENKKHDFIARTVKGLELSPQRVPARIKESRHLREIAELLSFGRIKPRVLVGADHWDLLIAEELKRGEKNEPAATKTQLGWVVHGILPKKMLTQGRETVLHIVDASDKRLEEIVKNSFEIESLGISLRKATKPEEEKAATIFEKTVRRTEEGRIEVGLTWKNELTTLPPSYKQAYTRLINLEKRMERDPVYKEMYTKQVQNLIDKGYVEEVNRYREERRWYLPHFGVVNINKPGKLRLVFDAAAQSDERSLNDFLLEGPNKLRDLLAILYQFREGKIAMSADIEEMFLQVGIREEDRPALTFLWRGENRSDPPKQYQFKRLIFGANCSPYLAHSARDFNAKEYKERFPAAVQAIQFNHYMDDYLDSYDTEEKAKEIAKEVDWVHRQAKFNLRSWSSNSQELLRAFPVEKLARVGDIQLTDRPEASDKTLGLIWNPQTDEIGFGTRMARVADEVKAGEEIPTKRQTLSAVMSIYDPLGLIGPYTITGRILLQEIWKSGISWDDKLAEEEAEGFKDWLSRLEDITKLKIRRQYGKPEGEVKRSLHVFADASEQAYAAAAYLRTENEKGDVEVSLIASKSKVAPIKMQTIPRLELQAAVIATRLAAAIAKEHRLHLERTVYWTDSTTVLYWIQNGAKLERQYVQVRLGEIQESTEPDEWRWVPSAENVADEATRKRLSQEVITNRWIHGPEFVRRPEEEWPNKKDIEHTYVAVSIGNSPLLIDPGRFSNYEKMVRSLAYALLFIEMLKKKEKRTLDLKHIKSAEEMICMLSQNESFAKEVQDLKKGLPISKDSRIYKLDPELMGGLLRLRGRINKAEVNPDMKHPIILDGKDKITRMLIEKHHRRSGHANNERVINDIRQQYWIVGLRPAVRTVAHACQQCRVKKATPRTPVTGDLPEERLKPFMRPFSNCGLDYFGPMFVKLGRRREKRWGALFTCMTTRAVHIELVTSLSTDSAIMALRRMAARRGWPAVIWSDNGTNFRGADHELRAAYKQWLPELKDAALVQRVQWKYIAPGAPHQGGAWERLVRSIKTALYATLRERVPTEEVLSTLLCEAEHSVNARPLTHVSVDPRDPEALTPNHFLLGSSSGLPITGHTEANERRIWRATQALADAFWRRWLREYLPNLVPRGQSHDHRTQPKSGDLVVVVDHNLPRNTWPRGIIERVWPGPDGDVRVAEVRTKGGVFRRPINRLAVLRVEEAAPGASPGGELLGTARPK